MRKWYIKETFPHIISFLIFLLSCPHLLLRSLPFSLSPFLRNANCEMRILKAKCELRILKAKCELRILKTKCEFWKRIANFTLLFFGINGLVEVWYDMVWYGMVWYGFLVLRLFYVLSVLYSNQFFFFSRYAADR